jgi:hypothetical protein
MGLSLNDVNRRNSFTWTKCNDDAKSGFFRQQFLNKFGGKFESKGKNWEWTPSQDQIIQLEASMTEPPVSNELHEPSKTWIFKNIDGNIVKTKNIQEFCKDNALTRSSLYEVMSGKRKQHKGFSFVETTIE